MLAEARPVSVEAVMTLKKNSKPLPEDVIHQIAVLAQIPSPQQILQFERALKSTVATFSNHASGLRPGLLTSDGKTARNIFTLSKKLDNQLASASPRLRHLLMPPWLPNKTAPPTLEDLTAAVATLCEMSRFAVTVRTFKAKLSAGFIRRVYQNAEECGGHLTRSKAMHGKLRQVLDLLRPYLPKEIETAVSSDTIWRATRAQGKNCTK
jgi:hypothetical protein